MATPGTQELQLAPRCHSESIQIASRSLPWTPCCQGYTAKVTLPRLHSQGYPAKVTPRLHRRAYFAKVTPSRLRCPVYTTKVTQPRLRCQEYAAKVTLPRSHSQGLHSRDPKAFGHCRRAPRGALRGPFVGPFMGYIYSCPRDETFPKSPKSP